MSERITPINVIEREWHTIVGHEHLGEFPFSGNPALTKCDEIAAETGTRPMFKYHSINRPTDAVIQELQTRLKHLCPEYANREYGFSTGNSAPVLWPDALRLAIYTVTGGSEGWYIHIDAIDKNGKRGPLALAKFLTTQDDALAVANMATKLLGA